MDVKRLKFVDRPFLLSLLALLIIGLVIQLSASGSISSDPYYYVKKQLVMIAIGLIAIIAIIRYDYLQLKGLSPLLYGFSVLMLVAVLIFGEEVRGTTGWIAIGPLPPIQPAEFTKILLVLSFADFLQKRRGQLNNLVEMLPCFVFMGVPVMLIMLQPDLGTALVYIAITFIMMYVAGANQRVLLGILLGGMAFIALVLGLHFKFGLWIPLKDYQLQRLIVFVNPYNDGMGGRGAGWNTIQSLVAIGSGGLAGKGLFQGSQAQLNFLPEHHTDFIYAVIGEELGFIGAASVLLLFAILLLRTVYIAANARELYGGLLVTGISAMWLFHIFENIGMCIGMMPVTGIPLPFISYGGSFMIANLLAVALILSVNVRGKIIVF
ncbi:MAG: rod shape-determining protein RodA [Syntrophomonadaceae bacterium]|mgnify:CR=1 FL=1|nr:rod shape-determining protein RodA [Syntrophomonadaceae bacterium]